MSTGSGERHGAGHGARSRVGRHHQWRRMLLSFERPTGRIPAGAFSADLENCTVIQQTGITETRLERSQLSVAVVAPLGGASSMSGSSTPKDHHPSAIQLLKRILAGPLR